MHYVDPSCGPDCHDYFDPGRMRQLEWTHHECGEFQENVTRRHRPSSLTDVTQQLVSLLVVRLSVNEEACPPGRVYID